MTIWRVFVPEYRGDVEIVGLKVWFLFEIIERQWHENTEGKMTKTPRKRTKSVYSGKYLFCFMTKNCYNIDYINKATTPNQKFQWDRYYSLNELPCLT